MFGMVIEKLFIQDLQKVSGTSEKKICAAGVTKLLTEAPSMISEYGQLW
jgi:exportin-2 (importin alpha re-exporter)